MSSSSSPPDDFIQLRDRHLEPREAPPGTIQENLTQHRHKGPGGEAPSVGSVSVRANGAPSGSGTKSRAEGICPAEALWDLFSNSCTVADEGRDHLPAGKEG